jgi:rhodanese-related sulfurtransferase
MERLYAGDVSPRHAWDNLLSDNSYIVDVRTNAEWHYVGVPNLKPVNKDLIRVEWRSLPDMSLNKSFAFEISNLIPDKEAKIYFLCRTGGRSMEAAILMTSLGYKNCYNIASGFEGDADANSQRGKVNGWKAEKLPWRQD